MESVVVDKSFLEQISSTQNHNIPTKLQRPAYLITESEKTLPLTRWFSIFISL